jgi:excisionase family DNA binding protein
MPELDPALTVPDVARWLAVSPKSVYRLVRSGGLEGFHVGSAVRIHRSAVDRFIASGRMGGAA